MRTARITTNAREESVKNFIRGSFIALSALSATAIAQGTQPKASVLALDIRSAGIARRIMLSVAPPAESLTAQFVFHGGVQAPPGTSPGAAAAGTLIGLLIVKSMEDSKQRGVAEFTAGVNDALSQVDMARELGERLRAELDRAGYLKGAVLERVSDASDLEQPGLLVHIKERDIYALHVRSAFDPQATSLHVLTNARLWRKDDPNPVYAGRLRYVSRSLGDDPEARRRWIADNGALLKRTLREGIAETARIFVADIAVRAGSPRVPAEPVQVPWIALETGRSTPGALYVLTQTEDRIVGQTKLPAEETLSVPREHAAKF
jgi:hypothetical protein